MSLGAEDIKNVRDAAMAVREMLIREQEREQEHRDELKEVFRRLKLVEDGQGFLAKRVPPKTPKFPQKLIDYGYEEPRKKNVA